MNNSEIQSGNKPIVQKFDVTNYMPTKHHSCLLNSFSNIDVKLCEKEASESLKEFDKINLEQEIAFNDFIETYNSKI